MRDIYIHCAVVALKKEYCVGSHSPFADSLDDWLGRPDRRTDGWLETTTARLKADRCRPRPRPQTLSHLSDDQIPFTPSYCRRPTPLVRSAALPPRAHPAAATTARNVFVRSISSVLTAPALQHPLLQATGVSADPGVRADGEQGPAPKSSDTRGAPAPNAPQCQLELERFEGCNAHVTVVWLMCPEGGRIRPAGGGQVQCARPG